MPPVATDDARSVVSVCASVTWICPAKTAEPIEMPFGELTLEGAILWLVRPIEKHWEYTQQKGSFNH